MGGCVYLIRFDRPIAPGRHTTQHCAGWEAVRGSGIEQHKKGIGSRLCQVASERPIGFDVVPTVPGDRGDERRLKRGHKLRRICPLCREQWAAGRRETERKRRAARRRLTALRQCIAAVLWLQEVWSALCAVIYILVRARARVGAGS